MALERVAERLERIVSAFDQRGVPYALVGGQAVIYWVSTKDPAATRTTKDVDIMIRRADLPKARAAARSVKLDYYEIMGVGMFLEQDDPNPRHAVHLLWAGEKVRPDCPLPSPPIENRETLAEGKQVVALPGLVMMKLMANRDHDRVHIRDMIGVGLIGHEMLAGLPPELASRLEAILNETGS